VSADLRAVGRRAALAVRDQRRRRLTPRSGRRAPGFAVHAAVMRALTYHGTRDVRVDTVPDPKIEHPTDAIIRVTSSGLCGSDLHLSEGLGASIDVDDSLGH